MKMKTNEKAIIVGVGALLAYFFMKKNKEKKEKKVNVPNLSISPPVFYA